MKFLSRAIWVWMTAIKAGLYPCVHIGFDDDWENPSIVATLFWELPHGAFDAQFSSPWGWARLSESWEALVGEKPTRHENLHS